MPELDFSSIGQTPAYVGRITLHIDERVTPEALTERKTDAEGNLVFIDLEGNETSADFTLVDDVEVFHDVVMQPTMDDDGTTQIVRAFDGFVESSLFDEAGTEVPGTRKSFNINVLPLVMRKDLKAIFNKIRKGYKNGYAGATGLPIRERK